MITAPPPFTQPVDSPFSAAQHTFVLSDIHLGTAEPPHPRDRLWKRFKQRDFFIDETFEIFLATIQKEGGGKPIELILAGDIFDFDGVTQLPKEEAPFRVSFLEKKRGLNAEEPKSVFKIRAIVADHSIFFRALSGFVKNGNRLVVIIGNHDLELHWPSVQEEVSLTMQLSEEERKRVRFTNWFYISNGDTLIEHGNQHDSHSNCQNPINPKIHGLHGDRIRLPFGCLANRYLINGMGYFNPHSDRSYLMTAVQYVSFYLRHVIRKDPWLVWNWFWGALATLWMTLKDGVALEVKNPLEVEDQVEEIARNANATPRMVRLLREVHAPPAIMDPFSVARELWLDRAFLVFGGMFAGFEIMSVLNVVVPISYWWTLVIFLAFVPFFMFYFRSVKSKVIVPVKYYEKAVKFGSQIAQVNRVVFGHTHEFVHTNFDGIEYLNSGTWSPAFDDVACTKPASPKTFVWIRPTAEGSSGGTDGRVANVYEWNGRELILLC